MKKIKTTTQLHEQMVENYEKLNNNYNNKKFE